MVLASALGADCGKRASVDEIAAQIHGNLPGLNYLALARGGNKVFPADFEILADSVLNLADAEFGLLLSDDFADYPFSHLDAGIPVGEGGVGHQGDECSLKLAETLLYVHCYVLEHVVGDHESLLIAAAAEHVEPGVVVRVVQFHGKSPFHSGLKSFLEVDQVLGCPV